MCDHCIKRDRAYTALSDKDKDAVDVLQVVSGSALTALVMKVGPDSEEFMNAYMAAGDAIDIALGILPVPEAPDTIPSEWSEPPAVADGN